jgi:enoyl-[acyl-carrier-protein] reductase (NADH)
MNTIRDMATHPTMTPEFIEKTVRRIPIRRQPTVEEFAWTCAFLCSPRSQAITGSVIHVDGGQWKLG